MSESYPLISNLYAYLVKIKLISIPGDPQVHFAGVVVLNATTMKEIGRAEFDLVGPAAKPLHGCFTPHKGIENYVFCRHNRI